MEAQLFTAREPACPSKTEKKLVLPVVLSIGLISSFNNAQKQTSKYTRKTNTNTNLCNITYVTYYYNNKLI